MPTLDVSPPAADTRSEEAPTRRRLDLRLPDRRPLSAWVQGVREGVAEVALEGEEGQALPVGLPVEALLTVKGLGRPLPGIVRVLWRTRGPSEDRYGLGLPALGQRGGALTAALCAAFNRRSTQRVRPEPLAHPLVVLQARTGLAARGPLGDISLGGLSMQVAAEAERTFARFDDVRVNLRLPTCSRPLDLDGRIRSRRLTGERVRYGVQFQPSGPARSALLDYVRVRRADCLRRARRSYAPELL